MEAVRGFMDAVPLDYLFLGGLALLLALDTLRSGMGRATAVAIAFPTAAFAFSYSNETAFVGTMLSSPTFEAGGFLILAIALYFLVRRVGLDYVDGGMGQPVQAAIVGVASTAICAIIWMHVSPLSTFWEFGPRVQSIFADQFRMMWILGAYAALAFARG